jgi:hypothetical protein
MCEIKLRVYGYEKVKKTWGETTEVFKCDGFVDL